MGFTDGSSSAGTLSSELVTNGTFATDLSGWTSTGWTWSSGKALHTAGNTNSLSQSITITASKNYLIGINLTWGTAGGYSITLDGNTIYNYNSVEATVNGTWYGTWASGVASGSKTLAIVPTSDFDGKIDNISVKYISANNGEIVTLNGYDAGELFGILGSNSDSNLAFGYNSFQLAVAANNNVAVGKRAMWGNISGCENVAFGVSALDGLKSGCKNTAVGWNALASNDVGFQNTAVGHGSLQNNTRGFYNLGLGYNALNANTTGLSNFGMGPNAVSANQTGNYLIGIGNNALSANTNGQCSSIGIDSTKFNTSGTHNVVYGNYSLQDNLTGSYNTTVGIQTLQVAMGNGNCAFGALTLSALVNGEKNTVIGKYGATNQTGGSRNIGIGADVAFPSTTGDDQLNIGNTLYGNLATGSVSLGVSSPNSKSLLDLTSTTLGFLPPRMTTTQRNAISSSPAGLTIYNSTTNKLNFYNGSAWEAVTSA